jgi:hypothetical protein
MSQGQLEIRLHSKNDKNGDEYFIGSFDAPPGTNIKVNLEQVTFVFFLPAEGESRGTLKIRAKDFKPRDRNTDEED